MNETNLTIKQFEELNIPIYGTYEEPLFKAKDIGDLLEIKDIRTSIKEFDEDDRHTMTVIDSIGRKQETTMLSESGLYKILMISRKPVAKQFQKWVFNVIKEIRKTGEYKNKEFIENESKSTTVIENYIGKSIAYIGVVKQIVNGEESYTIVKYGITRCVSDTLKRHRNSMVSNFILHL